MVPPELKILALGAVLLLVHIFAAAFFRTQQYGLVWNMGARDDALPPVDPITGRMSWAQANYMETLPIAIIALIGVVVAGRTSATTMHGGWIWLGARVVYLPLYGFGVPVVRTGVYWVSLIGLGMVLQPLLSG